MKLLTNNQEQEQEQEQAVIVVGVRDDTRSKQLLTWTLLNLANSGDRLIALHILHPNADKGSLLELMKTFESMLAAYQGFCNLKQIDLKLEVRRGAPVCKVMLREAKVCGCTSLVIGSSEGQRKMRSKISVAKYFAKNLQSTVSVYCIDSGKIVYQRESSSMVVAECGNLEVPESRWKRRKLLPKSPLGLPGNGDESNSMALVPIKVEDMHEPKPGWSLIRRVFMLGQRVTESPSTKKASLVQRILKLPSRQSVASIYPDQKHCSVSDTRLDLDNEKGAIVPYLPETSSVGFSSKNMLEELKGLVENYSTSCQVFSYQELLLATNYFGSDNLIGKGGSSRVFRGCLPDGIKLAVKVLNPSEEILRQFVSEIELITSLHHKNIISLLGFCFEEDRLLLVYNLLSRGSLEENLHDTQESGNSFPWEQRYKVALGVAKALDHLHSAEDPIIHRDVKSSNVLLADDFEPQISDFGLATWASSSSHHLDYTSDVAGTFGYLAPEYFMHGKVNQKIDVYAFGVVLLELLSGRKPIDDGPNGQESLVMWAEHILKEGEFSKLQDPELVDSCNQDQFERMVLAATLCIRHAPQSRPDITSVLKLLLGDPEVTEWAKQETSTSLNALGCEQSKQNIQSFINLALNDLEDDAASVSSPEPNISVNDYLNGRWSRCSSFD